MRLLIVEDKESFRRVLVQSLEETPWKVQAVGDPQEALQLLETNRFEAMVTDLRLPNMNGLDLLKQAKRLRPELRVVLMSAFGEAKDIVEAMRSGADDFLPKPFDLDLFQEVLGRLHAMVGAPPPDPREAWIAQSPNMRALEEGLAKASESDLNVLFLGEHGVGKSRAARRLHALRHPTAPFLTLHASKLDATGIDPGRLAMLQGGSLYLEDLETLSPTSLSSLLRIMDGPQSQKIHWMAGASDLPSVPLPLKDRLGVLCFEILPLRERREDILPLFRMLMDRHARHEGRPVPLIERGSERELLNREWAGNVHELIWCVSEAMRNLTGAVLGSLPVSRNANLEQALTLAWPPWSTLDTMLECVRKDAESQILRRRLKDFGRNLNQTAQALGITSRTLAQRLREYGIPLEE